MFKNIIIIVLGTLVVLFWLSEEEDDTTNDLDNVIIEYQCSDLPEYESVPEEVLQECKARGLVGKTI
jgi:hypothetical protein